MHQRDFHWQNKKDPEEPRFNQLFDKKWKEKNSFCKTLDTKFLAKKPIDNEL
jgi:hypothetical protein